MFLQTRNNNDYWICERIKNKLKYVEKLGNVEFDQANDILKVRIDERTKIDIWKNKVIPMPTGEFDVIYADPPWRYDFSKSDTRSIENQYPTMEIEEICKIKVPSAKDSVLYLWGTAPKLLEAIQVIKAWGFEYKTHAVWDKLRIGMGYYFRGRHELLLIGTKGSPGTPDEQNRPDSIITQARTKHSSKPEIVYEIIEKGYPNKKYLELFSRNKRNNWVCWGNQI